MTIKNLLGLPNNNKKDKFGNPAATTTTQPLQAESLIGESRAEIARILEQNRNNQLKEANERIRQEQQEQRRRSRRRRQTGSVRLSNTDSVGRAQQVRGRLRAKLAEVYGSDMDPRTRQTAAADIKMQLDRVERQIGAIRRRERAMEEERTTRRSNDTPEARRRRARDMQERSINIRRDFLFHSSRGGWDPNVPTFNTSAGTNAASSVAFDIGGNVGTMDIAAGADMEMAIDSNMEVVL
ncbi:MAG: hypothetical protein FWC89_11415 [Defluviitaleaceae bacterium]|nr:hypothetical protein [Defluviitaleaceae bacterium]